MISLCKIFEHFKHLKHLDLSGNYITSEGFSRLFHTLKHLKHLTHLSLTGDTWEFQQFPSIILLIENLQQLNMFCEPLCDIDSNYLYDDVLSEEETFIKKCVHTIPLGCNISFDYERYDKIMKREKAMLTFLNGLYDGWKI
jgi:hypothetical protein